MTIRWAMFSASVLALVAPAYAADPAMQQEQVADWSGFYAGFNLGYGMGNTRIERFGVAFDGLGSEGASGGVFAGYNYQFHDDWVAGFEFGGVLSDVRGHTELEDVDVSGTMETKTDWSAGVSARLGKLVSPETLIFGALGLKAVHGSAHFTSSEEPSQSADDMFTGFGTVTVGFETMLGGNWRLRGQYDADLLRYNNYDNLAVRPLIGTFKGSLIYALGDAQATTTVTSNADKWSGFYAGVVGGESHGVAALENSDSDSYFLYDGFGSAGWTGGLLAGANMRAAERLVIGAEVGLYGSSLDTYLGSAGAPKEGFDAVNDSWVEGRLRAGYLASDTTMLYGFAGVSRIDSKIGLVSDGDFVVEGDTISRTAATAGVGIETWVGDNITFRGEYEYAMLEPFDLGINGPDQISQLQQQQQTATVGVFYHFGK